MGWTTDLGNYSLPTWESGGIHEKLAKIEGWQKSYFEIDASGDLSSWQVSWRISPLLLNANAPAEKRKVYQQAGGREYGCQFAERSHLELLLREAAVRRTKVERPKEPGQVSMSWVAWAAYVCLGSFSLLFFGRWISVKTLFPTTNVAKFHKQRTALKVFKGWILSSIMSQKVLLYMTGS